VLFGTFNESRYFLRDFRDYFDLIGFNANIIAHAPDGIAAFVSKLLKKNYFIDPQTYAFQQQRETLLRKKDDEYVLKSSIEKLANSYGDFIKDRAGKVAITANRIDTDAIKDISEKVLYFQHEVLDIASKGLDVRVFLEDSNIELRPNFLIAPYLYIESDDLDNELVVNNQFIEESRKIVQDTLRGYSDMLFAEIVIGKEILIDNEKLTEVINLYSDCSANGFILWIDDFSELQMSEDTLKKYKDFLRRLSQVKKPIIALHGSYLSIAFAGPEMDLLAGVGHGIEYGEHRPVVPIGRGVPLAKFYFPKFYERINYSPDAVDILIQMKWHESKLAYHTNVCNCNICRNLIFDDVPSGFKEFGESKISPKNGKTYPTAGAMEKSRKHYLNCKIDEYDRCRTSHVSDIVQELRTNEEIAKRVRLHSFDHISRWLRLLP
jgi:hypothetical protein